MLLAVEGGGFFSSSALGYSKGLTLLLFGKKANEKKPMRVTPWSQYQLVDQESDLDRQLASKNNRLVRGCASFLCFSRAAAGLESPSPLKVGPTQNQQDVLNSSPDSEKVKKKDCNFNVADDDNVNDINACSLRSSLKKSATTVSVNVDNGIEGEHESEPVYQNETNDLDHTKRRVQWTDVSGGELFVIREFEPSEHSGSDDEFENGKKRICSCTRLM